MNMHKGARLTPYSRALLVRRMTEQGLHVEEAAQASGVSGTAFKWLGRFRKEGAKGLVNRASRPHTRPHATASTKVVQVLEQRRARQTYRTIAATSGVAPSTVSRLLQRAGLNRLASLEPARPILRYEHDSPGDLLHLDIKKLGRFWRPGHRVTGDRQVACEGAGWEYVHVAIDDHSRVAFSSIEPNEQAIRACNALVKALRYYRHLSVRYTRVLTDNGALLSLPQLCSFAAPRGPQPQAHPPLHATHQRQG